MSNAIAKVADDGTVSVVPIAQSETAAILSMIERAARDPSVDITKMERLFEMRDRAMRQSAESAFNAAMAAAQAELGPVVRNRRNDHSKSTYADLAAIAEAALPIVHKHGFGLTFVEVETTKPQHMGVSAIVRHAGGHTERHTFHVPIDAAGSQGKVNKTATQAYGSTYQYARRYATCGVFNITTSDDVKRDNDGAGALITEEQAGTLREMIESVDGNLSAFLGYFKVERLTDLPAAQYDRAIAALKKRAGQS